MSSKLSILLLSGLLVTACSGAPKSDPSRDEDPVNTDEPEQSTVEVAYIALDDNGASGPLVGCGDSEVLTEETVSGNLNTKERIQVALEKLFANKEQFLGESGLYNSLYLSTLTVNSITIKDGTVDVEISGDNQSGGECDDPRRVEQIRGTVENNIDSDREMTVIININGEPLEKLQDLSGR